MKPRPCRQPACMLWIPALLLLACVGCDLFGARTDPGHGALVAAARAYYEDAVARQPSEPAPAYAAYLVEHRPPDWSAAQVMRQPKGGRTVATLLDGQDRSPGDSLANFSVVLFEVGHEATINAAKILDFIITGAAQPTDYVSYVKGYWLDAFEEPYVSVAEFSIHYTPISRSGISTRRSSP